MFPWNLPPFVSLVPPSVFQGNKEVMPSSGKDYKKKTSKIKYKRKAKRK